MMGYAYVAEELKYFCRISGIREVFLEAENKAGFRVASESFTCIQLRKGQLFRANY
jgi:uncharacterized protein (DUF3084 family)